MCNHDEECEGCEEGQSGFEVVKLSSQDAMKLAAEDVIEGLEGMSHMMGRLHRACLMNSITVSPVQRVAMRTALENIQGFFSVINDLSEQ